jgi:hypothetical protein
MWVPNLLSEDQKQECVQTCKEFVTAVQHRSMAMLDCSVTIDKTMVSYHTHGTKKRSKQWIEKGQPGPIQARSKPASQNRCCWRLSTARA